MEGCADGTAAFKAVATTAAGPVAVGPFLAAPNSSSAKRFRNSNN